MIIRLSDANLNAIDLTPFLTYITWHQQQFFMMPPGENHCQLLSYFSSQLPPGSKIADLGTFMGDSAVSFATNPEVKVVTCDVHCHLLDLKNSCLNMPNVKFLLGDCRVYLDMFLDCHIIFLDIAPHSGDEEEEIVTKLADEGFRGLLICDDIHYSEGMKRFWNWVPLKKYDLTVYGHSTGTGVVVFDEKFIDVKVI